MWRNTNNSKPTEGIQRGRWSEDVRVSTRPLDGFVIVDVMVSSDSNSNRIITTSGMERHTLLKFKHELIPKWMPLLSEEKIHKKMRGDVTDDPTTLHSYASTESTTRVCDIGCGRGKALITLASLYPNCQYVGYDVFEPSLERARENAKEAGIHDLQTS